MLRGYCSVKYIEKNKKILNFEIKCIDTQVVFLKVI